MLIFVIFLTINYNYGIIKLKKIIDYYNFKDYKIILNSSLKVDLDFIHHKININDELDALLFAIHYYDIYDNDFIIKVNGNCTLKMNSPFMEELFKLDSGLTNYDVISKYFFIDIIGMRCRYVNLIDKNKKEHIQLRWEKAKSLIEEKKQLYLEYLGINISVTDRECIYTIY